MIHASVNDLDDTLTALADPTRRRVVELLRDGPRRASELADGSGMSRPAMSRHLRVLRSSGLVEVAMVEDDARGRIYQLRPERFVALQAWLDQVHAFWSEQLGSFKEHAETRTAWTHAVVTAVTSRHRCRLSISVAVDPVHRVRGVHRGDRRLVPAGPAQLRRSRTRRRRSGSNRVWAGA